MIFGFIATVAFCNYLSTAKRDVPTPMIDIDYNLPCIELEFRRKEIDAIEKELIEIESDLCIIDDISYLRNITLNNHKANLKITLMRHKNRIDEMGYTY